MDFKKIFKTLPRKVQENKLKLTKTKLIKRFNGYLSKLEYTNKALSTDQIMKQYKKGPTVKVSKGILNLFN
jgi:hypothetical protein